MRKKLLSMLVLLMTAVTGAWADDTQTINFPIGDYGDSSWGESFTRNGIKIQANGSDAMIENFEFLDFFCCEPSSYVTYTISMEDGSDILGVSMTIASNDDMFQNLEGWTANGNTRTWSGNAKSVTFRVNYKKVDNNDGVLQVSSLAVTIPAPPAVTLTDGNDLSGLSAYAGQTVDVTYSRSFTSGKTSTVCLPFAYTKKEGDGSFYAFTNIEEEGSDYVATMTEPVATTLTANTPYLYVPNATGAVDFSGTYAIPATLTAGETTSNGWTFKGTFETKEWTTAPTGIYGFSASDANDGITQGQFVKVGEYVRVKPMRCYLQYGDGTSDWAGARGITRAAAEPLPETIKVRLVGANGNITGIGTLQTKTGEVTLDGEAWYSLDGRRIEGKPSTKGIYVNNGKKVIINK